MITQEQFDVISEHIISCLATPGTGTTHLFSPSAFGDEATLYEVYKAFEDAGYDPIYGVGDVEVVL